MYKNEPGRVSWIANKNRLPSLVAGRIVPSVRLWDKSNRVSSAEHALACASVHTRAHPDYTRHVVRLHDIPLHHRRLHSREHSGYHPGWTVSVFLSSGNFPLVGNPVVLATSPWCFGSQHPEPLVTLDPNPRPNTTRIQGNEPYGGYSFTHSLSSAPPPHLTTPPHSPHFFVTLQFR